MGHHSLLYVLNRFHPSLASNPHVLTWHECMHVHACAPRTPLSVGAKAVLIIAVLPSAIHAIHPHTVPLIRLCTHVAMFHAGASGAPEKEVRDAHGTQIEYNSFSPSTLRPRQ
jgi:hypothetical protein